MGTNGQFKKQMDTFEGGFRTAVDETACEVRWGEVRINIFAVTMVTKLIYFLPTVIQAMKQLLVLYTTDILSDMKG